MKFVCMSCDAQMKSVSNERQREEGTMAIVMECPACFGQVAMLTNPMETRTLDALDVSVCPVGGKNRAAAAGVGSVAWSEDAESRLAKIPAFARDMVRGSIEQFAKERGQSEITAQVMDEARAAMGM